MKDTATRLTEYGVPIDPAAMVTPPGRDRKRRVRGHF